MKNLKDKESQHDNCYECGISLIKNYNQPGVHTIKDKKGTHYVCCQCAKKVCKPINVTSLGKLLTPQLPPVKTNILLEKLGFQTKVNGEWTATDKGKEYAQEAYSTIGRKSYLTWSVDIIWILK